MITDQGSMITVPINMTIKAREDIHGKYLTLKKPGGEMRGRINKFWKG